MAGNERARLIQQEVRPGADVLAEGQLTVVHDILVDASGTPYHIVPSHRFQECLSLQRAEQSLPGRSV
jgi:hypothetical protein